MALQKAMVSSNIDEWGTPWEFFNRLNSEFNFTLDPCATKKNAKCKKFFNKKQNGLIQNWSKDVVFMNPPYGGQTLTWLQKAYKEYLRGSIVVCLVSAGTGRKYWHNFVFPEASQIRFVRGFIKFEGAKYTAPFASALIIFDKRRKYKQRIVWDYPAKI